MKTNAYAAQNATTPLAPFSFERRDLGEHNVQIEISYCGVCHSDLHTVRSEWQGTTFPCVPGHEIVGHVTKVGAHVNKFNEGDYVDFNRYSQNKLFLRFLVKRTILFL